MLRLHVSKCIFFFLTMLKDSIMIKDLSKVFLFDFKLFSSNSPYFSCGHAKFYWIFTLLHLAQLLYNSVLKIVSNTIVTWFLTAFVTICRFHQKHNCSECTSFVCVICGCTGESGKVGASIVKFVDVSANPRCLWIPISSSELTEEVSAISSFSELWLVCIYNRRTFQSN